MTDAPQKQKIAGTIYGIEIELEVLNRDALIGAVEKISEVWSEEQIRECTYGYEPGDPVDRVNEALMNFIMAVFSQHFEDFVVVTVSAVSCRRLYD